MDLSGLFLLTLILSCAANPVIKNDEINQSLETTTQINNNSTSKNLYVIKEVVYEVGILTNEDSGENKTGEINEGFEEINVSFFHPLHGYNNNSEKYPSTTENSEVPAIVPVMVSDKDEKTNEI